MRYALLALLLVTSSTPAENFPVFAPRYEMVPCGQDDFPTLFVIEPGGSTLLAMRIETLSSSAVQIVGWQPRLFCSGME